MPATLEQSEPKRATPRSVFIFRFASTIVLWSIALVIVFSGLRNRFSGLISAFGLIALWEFYGMLDHKGLPNFKVTAMICGAVMLAGSFYYFSQPGGPAHSYDFEMAVLLFFLLTVFARQMFARLRDDEPLQTMAYTLFGLLYVLWLFNFMTKIVYVTPRSRTGAVTGQFYVSLLHRSHEIQRHGRVSDRQRDRPSPDEFRTSARRKPGKDFSARSVFSLLASLRSCSS